MTPQRLSALGIVAGRPDHIGADGVWNRVKEQHPHVELAIICRTLQPLKRLGVVTETVIGNKLHFSLADHHTWHNRMVCSEYECAQTITPDYLAEFRQIFQPAFGSTLSPGNIVSIITIGGVRSYRQSAD